jgi:hypothetical protein
MSQILFPLLKPDAIVIADLLRQGLNQADAVFHETGARLGFAFFHAPNAVAGNRSTSFRSQ